MVLRFRHPSTLRGGQARLVALSLFSLFLFVDFCSFFFVYMGIPSLRNPVIRQKRGTVCPHLCIAVLRKPKKKDIDTISPRLTREPLSSPSCLLFEISQVSIHKSEAQRFINHNVCRTALDHTSLQRYEQILKSPKFLVNLF